MFLVESGSGFNLLVNPDPGGPEIENVMES
jgi:hypothetical protein